MSQPGVDALAAYVMGSVVTWAIRMNLGSSTPEIRVFAALAACLFAGAALGAALMPAVYRKAPTELSRITTIMDALRGGSGEAPPLLLLGNSVVMNGLDGALLSKEMRLPRPAWNLGTTGQQLTESLFVVDALGPDTRTVVLGITTDEFLRSDVTLPVTKFVAFRMAGYQPSSRVLGTATELPALGEQLEMSRWRATLASRWVVRATVDLVARGWMRRDLALDKAMTDLVFPSPYTQPVSPAVLEHLLRTNVAPRNAFRPAPAASTLLLLMRDILREKTTTFVVAIMPDHPAKAAQTTPGFYAELDAFVERLRKVHHVQVLDLRAALVAQDFVDHVHPGGEGAAKLTRELAGRLLARTQEGP